LTWQQLNERILVALANHKVRSVLFVCGKRVNDDAGRKLVAKWDRAGHLIANHSHSHFYFNESANTDSDELRKVTLSEFEADALKNEPIIQDCRHFVRLFRYPFFKEGRNYTVHSSGTEVCSEWHLKSARDFRTGLWKICPSLAMG